MNPKQEYTELIALFKRCLQQELGLEETRRPASGCLETETRNPPTLAQIKGAINGCQKCRLHQGRTHIVFGKGNERAKLMIIGEAPGSDEDKAGEPFVGPAGQLLTRMLAAIKLSREEVYITNAVKCRPPQNRDPNKDEIETCHPYLKAQLDIIKPKLILTLGNFATQTLLETTKGITILRGQFFDYHGMKLLPTFHPAALLRTPSLKKLAWQDLQLLQKEYGSIHGL
ncbi:MAG: uracil-DNA glycosylase [bacterium]